MFSRQFSCYDLHIAHGAPRKLSSDSEALIKESSTAHQGESHAAHLASGVQRTSAKLMHSEWAR